jgi:flagellar biosynthesis GTPase FlhF
MTDTHASKVILHLLSAENKSYFQKEEIDMVHPTLRESVLKSKAQKQEKKEGEEKEEKEDEEMENTEQEGTEQSQDPLQPTKKSPEKIRKELLQHMSLALIETISNNMKTVIAHNVANKVVLETFLNPEIPNEALYTQLIELLVENKEQAGLLLSQQASSRMLSRLIMSEESHTFATQLLEALSGDKLKKFVLESHGAYLVAALYKVKDIKARLKPFMDQVRKGTEPGLKFLTGTVEGFKE